jgi:signal transduction histidine kinase
MDNSQGTQASDQKKYQDFLNMAAHELRTPVAVLKAYLQMLELQLNRENHLSYINTIEKMDLQLNKLLHLISDLQDGVQANSEELHCLMNDFDINDSVKVCCDSAKAANPDCAIDHELDEACPALKGDHDRIEQVIHNLIANAIKYSKGNKIIKIRSFRDGSSIIVSVLDNGPGIPPDQQSKIFEQFYRVKTTAGHAGGLGLGLFICQEIIRKHDGKIGVKSQEGQGSEFWFSLPVKSSERQAFMAEAGY